MSDAVVFLVILGIAMVLFWRDLVPPDVVALGALLAVVLTGLLPADQAFRGFGSDTVLMILGLLLMTSALVRTGVVEILGGWILRAVGDRPGWLPMAVLTGTALTSVFMNNTAAAAFFLPITLGLARRSSVSASRMLLPMAFGAILASSTLLISTSTNVVVSGLLAERRFEPLSLFELAPVGFPILALGILYMATVGKRLIPDRTAAAAAETDRYGLRPYLSEVMVLAGSPLAGKTLAASGLGRDLDLVVLRIARGERTLEPAPDLTLAEGDVLTVEGRRDEILRVKDQAGIDIKADAKFALDAASLGPGGAELAEALLLVGSPLLGSTLKESRFRERYGLQVLAIHRQGATLHRKLSEVRLAVGDLLLVQGPARNLRFAEEDGAFRVLGSVESERPNRAKAGWAVAAFALALVGIGTEAIPLPVAVLGGALLSFVFGCVSPADAYRDVDWRVLILIACMLGVGRAMEASGAAALLAESIVDATRQAGPLWILGGFFWLTVLLTQPMSNQAAAVVVFPVAVEAAGRLGLDARPFAVMVAVASSCSYMTPLEPACLMVYGPGRYRFSDFLRVGTPLTLLIFALALVIVPRVWPL